VHGAKRRVPIASGARVLEAVRGQQEEIAMSAVAIAVLKKIAQVQRSEEGQDLLEYGLLAALIAVVAIGAVSAVGTTIYTAFWQSIALASSF
jgi:pilus assembly protein Flp/PilA